MNLFVLQLHIFVSNFWLTFPLYGELAGELRRKASFYIGSIQLQSFPPFFGGGAQSAGRPAQPGRKVIKYKIYHKLGSRPAAPLTAQRVIIAVTLVRIIQTRVSCQYRGVSIITELTLGYR